MIVISLVAAGVLASELYARHRAESVVAAATECVVQDKASVSFGATPFLLQLATGHFSNISIHTAGNRIGPARGMRADVRIDDVRLEGDTNAMGAIGALRRHDHLVCRRHYADHSRGDPAAGRLGHLGGHQIQTTALIELHGDLGGVIAKPQVEGGGVALEVVDVTGLGLLVGGETVQSALDAFTTHLNESYPLGIHAYNVQVTDDGVTAQYSNRVASTSQGSQGNEGDQGYNDNQDDPCFANL